MKALNQADAQYHRLLLEIMANGKPKSDRTGTGTKSVFGQQIRFDVSDGFPLLTTKKMYWKGIVTELLWFLRGDTNIKYLVDNGCNIWNGDAYKKYEEPILKQRELQKNKVQELRRQGKKVKVVKIELLSREEFINKIKTDDEFAKKWGELGPIYGKQWRSWRTIDDSEMRIHTYETDQISNLIEQLKTNPDSRRLMVNAWNVGELNQMTLPPCHYGFQVYTRELSMDERIEISTFWHKDEVRKQLEDSTTGTTEKYVLDKLEKQGIPTRAISLMWNQRSVDVGLGLPFNIASYGLLLHMIAQQVNMVPGELIGNLGDTHIYSNHIEQIKEQMKRSSKCEQPKLVLNKARDIFSYTHKDFDIQDYDSHPSIKMPLSV